MQLDAQKLQPLRPVILKGVSQHCAPSIPRLGWTSSEAKQFSLNDLSQALGENPTRIAWVSINYRYYEKHL